MKFFRWSAALIACLLLVSCSPSIQESTERPIPAIVRRDGTRELMSEAVSLSGYADSGLTGLTAYGYGVGIFDDYYEIQANPLTSADYVLSAQKAARSLNKSGQGLAEFFRYASNGDTDKSDFPIHNSLSKALQATYTATGDDYEPAAVDRAVKDIPNKVKKPLARWLSAAAAAFTLVDSQTSEISDGMFSYLADFTHTRCATTDTAELESMWHLANTVSEEVMQKAGAILIEVTVRLYEDLANVKALTRKDTCLTIPSPLGNILLGSSGADTYTSPEALLILDPAGDDAYVGQIAAGTSQQQCLSVVVDMAGSDTYTADNVPSQGCGILGVGLLFDMQGDDIYTADRLAQGCSIIGTGLLYDGDGNDSYTCAVTGQASGFYGVAILADADGTDNYSGYGFVQASAGNRCKAYLIDGGGNDRYETPVYTPVGYGSLDYGGDHEGKNGGFSQGCGWGQRNISDHGLAGGVAGMIDFGGDDVYIGGLWVQGTGYWSGIGFLYNEGGNDQYEAFYYSQASVAHYGAGIVIDTSGNDSYTLTRGAGLSFVWDRGVSFLADDRGDDVYSCFGSNGAVANSYYDEKGIENQDMTYAILLDAQGNDEYIRERISESYGYGRGGYFLDSDGEDNYWNRDLWGNEFTVFAQDFQRGGVFIDASKNEDEVPYIAFWENAKRKAGFICE